MYHILTAKDLSYACAWHDRSSKHAAGYSSLTALAKDPSLTLVSQHVFFLRFEDSDQYPSLYLLGSNFLHFDDADQYPSLSLTGMHQAPSDRTYLSTVTLANNARPREPQTRCPGCTARHPSQH